MNSKSIRYSIDYDNKQIVAQQGGAFVLAESKKILLSCKEFDSVVDKIMLKDGNTTVKRLIETQNDLGEAVPVSTGTGVPQGDITLSSYEQLQQLDNDETLSQVSPTAYTKFCSESRFKDNSDTRKLFARKVNKLVSQSFLRGFINWNKYDDSTPDIKMDSTTIINLRNADVIYLAYFSEDEPDATKFSHQLMLLYSLAHYGVKSITIVLPYYPVGTMERIVGEGEIPTGYAFAQMLNNIPAATGKNNIIIFDIHALSSRFFFHTNLRPTIVSMLSYYLKYINDRYPGAENNNIIVFPDDGAKKRFEKQMPKKFKTILCSKERKGEDRIIKIEEGIENIDLSGKTNNLFIIDDLIQSGGTSKETVHGIKTSIDKIIKKAGSSINVESEKFKYFTMITHLVAPNAIKFFDFIKPVSMMTSEEKKKTDKLELVVGEVEKLITTNTRPLRGPFLINKMNEMDTPNHNLGNKIEIIDISEILHDVLTKPKDTVYIAPNIMM